MWTTFTFVCFVSIAGAILWGVLLPVTCCDVPTYTSFNRRGDSLGGAADDDVVFHMNSPVSIAGAILWGVLPHVRFGHTAVTLVSIAGAILWGVLHQRGRRGREADCQFQSQGRFFGGCCSGNRPKRLKR